MCSFREGAPSKPAQRSLSHDVLVDRLPHAHSPAGLGADRRGHARAGAGDDDHDVLGRGYGACQGAAVSRRRSAGDGDGGQPGEDAEDQPNRAGTPRGLAAADADIRRDLRLVHRERDGDERRGARAARRPPRRAAVLRGLRDDAARRARLHRRRRALRRSARRRDQRAVVDAPIQPRSGGGRRPAGAGRQRLHDRRRDAGHIHQQPDRRVAAGADAAWAAAHSRSALSERRRSDEAGRDARAGGRRSGPRAAGAGRSVSRVGRRLVGGDRRSEGVARRRLPARAVAGVRGGRASARDCHRQHRRAVSRAGAAAGARARRASGDRRITRAGRRRRAPRSGRHRDRRIDRRRRVGVRARPDLRAHVRDGAADERAGRRCAWSRLRRGAVRRGRARVRALADAAGDARRSDAGAG